MNKKYKTYLKLFITFAIAASFVWFIILKPTLTFKSYEKTLEDAARRYYELNSSELPDGDRVETIDMQTLYYKSYIKEDFYIPYSKKTCSAKESWVKVKKEKDDYKYYTYLKCGGLESKVDGKGPEIVLNGADEITINIGDEYKELGVKSVTDKTDGKLSTDSVVIDNKKVKTDKVGVYTVTYTAIDSLKNKSVVTRKVIVVSKLKNAVLKATDNTGVYQGSLAKNYIYFSGMLFRLITIDDGNVKMVTANDIANVNYDGISKWLEYFEEHINPESKKMLVKNKYCNMELQDTTIDTTECTSFTKERYSYIPSIIDINKTKDNTGSYLNPTTMSWTANDKNEENAFAVRDIIYGSSGKNIYPDSKVNNYGVRPVLTIKGSTLISSGDGTKDNPYIVDDLKQAEPDDLINTRTSGEYVIYSNMIWRIIETNKDGTTKIISMQNVKANDENIKISYPLTETNKQYNPTKKGNIGYYVNNKLSEYVDTSYLVNKEVSVPIYEKDILYGKEKDTKKYKVKLSVPNTYEMFSTYVEVDNRMKSYWLINSSKEEYYKGVVTDIGVVLTGRVSDYEQYGIRVVGNLKKDIMIKRGKGTIDDPYYITD